MKFGSPTFFFLLVFLNNVASAQSKQEDSSLFQEAISNTLTIYNERLSDQSPLFNGSQYIRPEFEFKEGSAYFLTSGFTENSSVVYDQIQFDSLSLLYEDLRQRLVSKSRKYQLQLVNRRISSFCISGHQFIRLVSDSLNSGIGETGFYEVLYQGNSSLLKWTFKEFVEELSISEGVVRNIKVSNKYFIKKKGKYYRIKSKRDLLDVFQDHQMDIEHFIKKSHLKIQHDSDNTLIQSVRYYDLISH
jgi:hypothetical protein